jgi:AraC-like DNA-binding protein
VIYRRHIPGPPLNDFIDCFWYYKGFFPDHSLERVVPDGSIELLIDLEGPAKKLYSDETGERYQEFRRSWISGQHSRFLVIGAEQNSSMMGIRFRPGGVHPFLPLPVCELNEQVVDTELIWGPMTREILEQIFESVTVEEKFQILEQTLWTVSKNKLETDASCMYALARLQETNREIRISELSKEMGVSQRQLLRYFRQRVGLSPKALAQVFRFQSVIGRLNNEVDVHWAQIAIDAGYFDQAHFVKDFQRFTGLNPSYYLLEKRDYTNFIPIR